jgi:hypothetical protein
MFGLGLAIAIALLTTLAFVGLWYAIPARRRRRVRAHYRPRRS